MKPRTKILIVLAVVAVVAGGSWFAQDRTYRDAKRIAGGIKPGTPYAEVVAQLGKPVNRFDHVEQIEENGTRKDREFTGRTVLYTFGHKGIPYLWILVYTDLESKEVLYADYGHM